MDREKKFNLLHNELISDGYKEKDISLSFWSQNIIALLVGIPLTISAVCIYGFADFIEFISHKPLNFPFDFLIYIAIILILALCHEHLHALGYVFFLNNKWKSIDVWVHPSHHTPTCYFGERLLPKQYILGNLMPLIIFAVLPIVIGLLLNSGLIFLLGLFNIFICGDDIVFACVVAFYMNKNTYILAHPQKCGCIIYSK